MLPVATDGIAKMIMNAATNWAHTNSGMRFSDIPGARILSVVAMITIAPMSAEISVNVIICAQTSTRFAGEYAGPESGTYANQPASGPVFRKNATYRNTPPARKIQYPSAFRRGNAMLRAPTISGTKYSPIPTMTGTANRNIIVVPCMVKIWLYLSGPTSVFSGRESCARMTAASRPPSANQRSAVVI